MKMKKPITHFQSLECWNANEKKLRNPKYLKKFLCTIAKYCNSKARKFFCDHFKEGGMGITAMLTVQESFIIVETWPEINYLYVCARLCGKQIKIDGIKKALKEFFPEVKKIKVYEERMKKK